MFRSLSTPRLLIVVASAAATIVASAQTPSRDTPRFRSEVNYVRVDVYPTLDGRPVDDLVMQDFEVLEDGVRQQIDAFERVSLSRPGVQPLESRPRTTAESVDQVSRSRARVFVVFLDVSHVELEAAARMRQPLVRALQQMFGPDDLIGIMTPDMAASDITFDRQVASVDAWLGRYWMWGQRGRVGVDAREQLYQSCYPGMPPEPVPPEEDDRGVADEMIARRREHLTIAALGELTDYLRLVRDERKGVIVVSGGWQLFKPDRYLQRALHHRLPGGPTVGVDPRTGQLSTRPADSSGGDLSRCEADRFALAEMNDASEFDEILGRANRANVTFYPIDPRGLVAFDSQVSDQRTGRPPAGKGILPTPQEDSAMLGMRQGALRTLAVGTDGMAIMNTSDLDGGLRRIVDDLSVYYLLGYSSTGKSDGRFHSIQVRVARRGVAIRARRGFQAITQAQAAAIAARSAKPAPVDPSATAFTDALATLGTIARTTSVRVLAAAGWNADGSPVVWITGELGTGEEWRNGARVDANATIDGGDAVSSRARVEAGSRTFELALTPPARAAGEATLSVRVSPDGGGPSTVENVRVKLPNRGAASGALVKRKGPSTANRVVPAADLRFRRSEQIVVEQPALAPIASTVARLLDRNSKPMPLTLAIADRADTAGIRWVTASLALAPLAPGDYVIELVQAAPEPARTLVAFRVTP